LHALRLIGDRFLVGPAGGGHSLAQIDECSVWHANVEGANRVRSTDFSDLQVLIYEH
jgi:hypothetical protein